MQKVNKSYNKSSKSASGSATSQRKGVYGYRPTGNRTSECSTPPNSGSNVKESKHK